MDSSNEILAVLIMGNANLRAWGVSQVDHPNEPHDLNDPNDPHDLNDNEEE